MGAIVQRGLVLAGAVMWSAAVLHLAAIFAGPAFIASLGAPPDIVLSAEQGTALAPVVISAIAALLVVVGLYALSAAGHLRRLPCARPVLYLSGAVLVLRAAALPLLLAVQPQLQSQLSAFEIVTAFLCFGLGLVFIGGALRLAPAAAPTKA